MMVAVGRAIDKVLSQPPIVKFLISELVIIDILIFFSYTNSSRSKIPPSILRCNRQLQGSQQAKTIWARPSARLVFGAAYLVSS
jgi:hypothetical protein